MEISRFVDGVNLTVQGSSHFCRPSHISGSFLFSFSPFSEFALFYFFSSTNMSVCASKPCAHFSISSEISVQLLTAFFHPFPLLYQIITKNPYSPVLPQNQLKLLLWKTAFIKLFIFPLGDVPQRFFGSNAYNQ